MGYLNTFNIGGTDYAISDGGLYGTCSTAAGTAAKVVTCANFDELVEGVTIRVFFSASNTAASPTLNVNGTGAVAIGTGFGNGALLKPGTTANTSWLPGAVVSFTYTKLTSSLYAWILNDYIANTDTDTKNTAGATYDSSNTLYLIGARAQTANPVTYSGNVRVADGDLFADSFNGVQIDTSSSAGFKLLAADNHGLTVPYGQDYTLAAACAKAVDTSISSTTSTNLPTSAAVAAYVNSAIGDMSGALVYKGTAATASAISGTSYKKGWYWIAADTFALTSSINVEPGDMIIAKQDKTSTFANDIDVVQTNIDTLTTTEIDNLWAAA